LLPQTVKGLPAKKYLITLVAGEAGGAEGERVFSSSLPLTVDNLFLYQ